MFRSSRYLQANWTSFDSFSTLLSFSFFLYLCLSVSLFCSLTLTVSVLPKVVSYGLLKKWGLHSSEAQWVALSFWEEWGVGETNLLLSWKYVVSKSHSRVTMQSLINIDQSLLISPTYYVRDKNVFPCALKLQKPQTFVLVELRAKDKVLCDRTLLSGSTINRFCLQKHWFLATLILLSLWRMWVKYGHHQLEKYLEKMSHVLGSLDCFSLARNSKLTPWESHEFGRNTLNV